MAVVRWMLDGDAVRGYLSHLAAEQRVAASTQNQALAARRLLYGAVLGEPLGRVEGIVPARRARRVPVVLSQREVRTLLGQLREPYRLCAELMYGSGLRVTECVSLRVKDVDLVRRRVPAEGARVRALGSSRRVACALVYLPCNLA